MKKRDKRDYSALKEFYSGARNIGGFLRPFQHLNPSENLKDLAVPRVIKNISTGGRNRIIKLDLCPLW
jgi:hypothetical protein